MLSLFPPPANSRVYRLHARVIARDLPEGEKGLRLRCTLTAEDHSIIGVSTILIALGTGRTCDQVLELLHVTRGADLPAAFELTLALSPQTSPRASIVVSGVIDPTQVRITLPDILLDA